MSANGMGHRGSALGTDEECAYKCCNECQKITNDKKEVIYKSSIALHL
jgi:hypothetical protein